MRHTPHYLMTDAHEVIRLLKGNPWMTYVSPASGGLVASHYPTLVEDSDGDEIVVVSHFGRPDEVAHELGQHEVLVIAQGPHGYISPNWYAEGDFIPTWNHVTAHLWGVPELLSPEENFQVLHRLTDHFEQVMPEPRSLTIDESYAERVAKGTVGLRIRVTRWDARAKLSQNKAPEVRARIREGLRGDGPYAHPALADEMERLEGRE
ncbi:FMN-binding negative transcriptional regulator [Homoserinibacter sp. GY 40078]|uniref:FMN-binding negative transcriptional regulator n=1 Tax=Homoserinibacter sp. GY 40078 TaxID=2603275 RepID=UPI0011CAD102|nr:FMN-binding negative transcriptional regulator [Homoserinibacter sp. GY 40078]TXK19667.1 FMN-binding negative transcriptional regulator [Homoserinibacter sp. GY 40078]